jgi:hypothetical protein
MEVIDGNDQRLTRGEIGHSQIKVLDRVERHGTAVAVVLGRQLHPRFTLVWRQFLLNRLEQLANHTKWGFGLEHAPAGAQNFVPGVHGQMAGGVEQSRLADTWFTLDDYRRRWQQPCESCGELGLPLVPFQETSGGCRATSPAFERANPLGTGERYLNVI